MIIILNFRKLNLQETSRQKKLFYLGGQYFESNVYQMNCDAILAHILISPKLQNLQENIDLILKLSVQNIPKTTSK